MQPRAAALLGFLKGLHGIFDKVAAQIALEALLKIFFPRHKVSVRRSERALFDCDRCNGQWVDCRWPGTQHSFPSIRSAPRSRRFKMILFSSITLPAPRRPKPY